MAKRFVTANGNLLHVVYDGFGQANHPGRLVAFHTDATQIGPWELFKLEPAAGGTVIRTDSGNLVTAVKGGGLRENWSGLATVSEEHSYRNLFDIVPFGDGRVALRTLRGNYLTALEGGGYAEQADQEPLHTDATAVGPWEVFQMIEVEKKPSSPTWIPHVTIDVNSVKAGAPRVDNDGILVQPWSINIAESFVRTVDKVRCARLDGESQAIQVSISNYPGSFPVGETTSEITSRWYGEAASVAVTGLYSIPVGDPPFSGVVECMFL
jgi:hypothetical protein